MGKGVNFYFPKSGRMSLCICSFPPIQFLWAGQRGRQGLNRFATLVLLAAFCQSMSDLFWLGSYPGVEWYLEGLKFWRNWSSSHQPRAEPLSKYFVPGSNYCEDVKFLSVSEACPSLFYRGHGTSTLLYIHVNLSLKKPKNFAKKWRQLIQLPIYIKK